MAIEVGKTQKKSNLPKGFDPIFYLALVIFLLAGAAFGVVFWFNMQALEEKERLEELTEEQEMELAKRSELEEEVREYSNLVEDFQFLVRERYLASEFFQPFQKAIHPRVVIFNANVSMEEGRVDFDGETESFVAIGQQFRAFQDIEYTTNIEMNSLSLVEDEDGERVTFSFTMTMNPDVFKGVYSKDEEEEKEEERGAEEEMQEEDDDDEEEEDDSGNDDEEDDDDDDKEDDGEEDDDEE